MTTREDFEESLTRDPSDMVGRLMYSDFLEEQGETPIAVLHRLIASQQQDPVSLPDHEEMILDALRFLRAKMLPLRAGGFIGRESDGRWSDKVVGMVRSHAHFLLIYAMCEEWGNVRDRINHLRNSKDLLIPALDATLLLASRCISEAQKEIARHRKDAVDAARIASQELSIMAWTDPLKKIRKRKKS